MTALAAVALAASVLLAGCGSATVLAASNGPVTPALLPPVATAGGPYTGTAGSATVLSANGSSSPQGSALTYAWTFGDGTTGTGLTATHTYPAAGTYAISLTVTDASNLSTSASTTATIAAVPAAGGGVFHWCPGCQW